MKREELDERLAITAPIVEKIVQGWVRQLPDMCDSGEAVSVLHGPIPLAPSGSKNSRRYVASWALYEWRGDAEFWLESHAFRWRWRALRYGRRKANALLAIRKAVKAAEALGR